MKAAEALVAAAWLTLAACAPAPTGERVTLSPAPVSRTPYQLLILARPTGSWPVPAGFDAAEAAFARAGALYERGAYREAAGVFMEAALALRLPAGEHHASAFEANRIWAYRNAAYAWAMANGLDEARRRLTEAAAADLPCGADLRKIIDELPPLMRAP